MIGVGLEHRKSLQQKSKVKKRLLVFSWTLVVVKPKENLLKLKQFVEKNVMYYYHVFIS